MRPRPAAIGYLTFWLSGLAALRVDAAAPNDASISPVVGECVRSRQLSIAGSAIDVEFDEREFAVGPVEICRWIDRGARAVSAWFGRFPVAAVRLRIRSSSGSGVAGGTTDPGPERPVIVIDLGREATPAQLQADWVMTHELVHLAVPSVPRRSHWLGEGIATYVEPIARVQIGDLSARRVWSDMYRDMRKGLPADGDQGLDRTPTWGRTYWGGALFCLLADVEIRKRTGNRMGLRDALGAVVAKGGNIQQDWTVARVLAVGD